MAIYQSRLLINQHGQFRALYMTSYCKLLQVIKFFFSSTFIFHVAGVFELNLILLVKLLLTNLVSGGRFREFFP